MKKSNQSRRGLQDSGPLAVQQPEKAGWIRKFCGRGIFRELWRSRYLVLKGDHLYISDKEVKDERKAQEVFDLADYERSEELRKAKSRSKKNHSRFTLLRCKQRGNTVPNLVFLAVSPEEKESWINTLNVAIIRAKNRVLDEVTIEEDSALDHLTRDRAKIPHSRRLPTRGHLMAVASTSSHGMLTLDLVAEEDGFCLEYDDDESWEDSFRVDLQKEGSGGGIGGRQRAGTDVSKLRVMTKEPKVKTGSLPRGSERSWGKQSHLDASKVQKNQQVQVRHSGSSAQPVGQLQSLIAQRMQRAQELLEEMRLQRERGGSSTYLKGINSPRLHHLRGSDSPHSRSSGSPRSRSSDSPRLRGKDSPRLRGRESPRSKAKKNRSKAADSPRSRGSHSPAAKAADSPRLKDPSGSPRSKSSDAPKPKGSSGSNRKDYSPPQKTPETPPCLNRSNSCQAEGSGSLQGSETDSPHLGIIKENQQNQNSPGLHRSFDSDQEVERRRAEAERLLEEAVSSWKEAQEVLQEVKELQSQTLRRQQTPSVLSGDLHLWRELHI
uniref:Pleckstrin homology domain containing, family O member 1a n=1 Tax=Poecilia latipinna TaxID=48699 RepID=A0A3B3UU73_9TELE